MDTALVVLLTASAFGIGLCAGYLLGYPHGQREREPSRPLLRTRLPPLPPLEPRHPADVFDYSPIEDADGYGGYASGDHGLRRFPKPY